MEDTNPRKDPRGVDRKMSMEEQQYAEECSELSASVWDGGDIDEDVRDVMDA